MDFAEEIDFMDRKIRSYITAMLLNEDDEMGDILRELDSYKDNPAYTMHLMTTIATLTGFLLSGFLQTDDPGELFAVWVDISADIEMSLLFGPDNG